MAVVKLKDVTVTRLNNTGHGVKVTETNERDGRTYATSYTLWFKEPSGLVLGEVVSVSGFLSAKVGEPWVGNDGQERRSVELGVNNPRIDAQDAAGAPEMRQNSRNDQQPAPAPFEAPGWQSAEVPF